MRNSTRRGSFSIVTKQIGGDILEIRLSNGLKLANDFSITAGINFSQGDNYSELIAGIATAKQF